MAQPRIRVVIDTNVWVEIYLHKFITPPPKPPYAAIVQAFYDGEFVPVYSQETFDELLYMLTRSAAVARKHGLDAVKAGAFVGLIFAKAGEEVSITNSFVLSSDPDDDCVAETAYVGRVDFLVSDDQHLHEQRVIDALTSVGVRVLWSTEFRDELVTLRGAEPAG